jgi:hypothetical protein
MCFFRLKRSKCVTPCINACIDVSRIHMRDDECGVIMLYTYRILAFITDCHFFDASAASENLCHLWSLYKLRSETVVECSS